MCARRENAVCAPCTRCEHAAATACALWKRQERCKDAVGRLCALCRDVVYTLWLTNLIFLGVFRSDHTARWHGFKTLYKRCGIAVWCDRGLTGKLWKSKIKYISKSICTLTTILKRSHLINTYIINYLAQSASLNHYTRYCRVLIEYCMQHNNILEYINWKDV